ncbi:MAG: hypothetical protein ABR526_11075 [Chthoniobacterales bacterium]
MRRITTFFLPIVLLAQLSAATAQQPRAHASREAAIQLLRREGFVQAHTRVVGATWNSECWVISLRNRGEKTTNWTVDAAAKDYTYLCPH